MPETNLLTVTDRGLYCPPGDFYVDPWRPVPQAVVTHAHADHFARNCGAYLVAGPGEGVFRLRLGASASISTLPYYEPTTFNGVTVSFHPAGHLLGSAQIRLEYGGEVWVVTGDYKLEPDPTCTPFEVVRCDTLVTEATFGLPIYHWPPAEQVFAEINAWWRANAEQGKASVLFGYALGKAQRLLAGVDPSIGPIYTHGAVEKINAVYREGGVALPETTYVTDKGDLDFSRALVVAPPSARGSTWLRRFGDLSTGFASGWMRIRGPRRRRAVDRGFVLSDHIDWAGLLHTVERSGAARVWATHGYVDVVSRWLNEHGTTAVPVQTRYQGEFDDSEDEA